MKCTTGLTKQVEVFQLQPPLQSEVVSEVHMHNPNYKGKNYDPNFQAKCVETTHSTPHNSKQQQNSFMTTNQYKTTYNKPTSTYGTSNNTPLTNSSDIVGEVTLKTSVDGYQLLKVNEMIKNAVAWRVRMPKMSKFSKYFDNNAKEETQGTPEPKVHINEATLELWAKLLKTSATRNKSLSKLWRCTSTSATRTWKMFPSPTHRTGYQSTTDLMATIKMYIAQTSIL